MSKTLELAFVMAGKLAPSFMEAAKSATSQLAVVEKKTKDIQKASERRASATSWKNYVSGISNAKSALSGFKSEIAGTFKLISGLALGNGILGGSIYGIAKSSASYADTAIKNAQAVGMTTAAFTELSYAAKMAGADQQLFITASGKLNKSVQDALAGNKKAIENFNRAGVTLRDSEGNLKTTERLWMELADTFASMPDGIGKTALAMSMFGETGSKLIPFLNGGSAALTQLREDARRLGISLSEADAKNAEAFNDSFANIGESIRGVSIIIGKQLWPVFTKVHDFIANKITAAGQDLAEVLPAWIEKFEQGWDELEPQLDDAWVSIKNGIYWADSLAQSFGGWIPLVQSIIKYWLYWRGIRIGKEFVKTGLAVRSVAKEFLNLQYGGIRLGTVLRSGLRAPFSFAKHGFISLISGAKRWYGTMYLVFDAFKDGCRHAAAGLGKLATAAGGSIIGAFNVLSAGFKKAALSALKFTYALLTNPITWIVAGIVALVAAVVWCYYNWDKVTEWLTTAWEFWKSAASSAFSAVADAFTGAWETVKGVVVSGWNLLPDWMQEPLSAIGRMIAGFGSSLVAGFDKAFTAVTEFFGKRFAAIRAAFDKGLLSGIFEILKQFNPVAIFTDALNELVDFIVSFDIFDAGKRLIANFGEGILSAWESIKGTIASSITDFLPDFITGKSSGDRLAAATQNVQSLASSVNPGNPDDVAALILAQQKKAAALQESMNRPWYQKFAEGGIVRSPQVAMVGEAGPEVIVPVTRPRRARELMGAAASMMGLGGDKGGSSAINVSFSPTINITGDVDKESLGAQIASALENERKRLEDMIRELTYNDNRLALW